MFHRIGMLLAVAAVVMLPAFGPRPEPVAAQVACSYQLGFAVLHSMIPEIVGACRENEWHNALNGDGLQQTTGGLMVWRKSDNWTAFTNGSSTWINGPFGLQSRLNTELFPWEATTAAPSPAQPGGSVPAPAPAATAVPSAVAPVVSLDLSDDRVNQGKTITIRLEATSAAGIESMWWWASSTDDNDLRDTHTNNCRGANPCSKSWDVSTNDTGTITIRAKARDVNGVESAEVTQDLRVREATATPVPTATRTPVPAKP